MKIGLLAYSTDTGLGIQTHNFFLNMSPHKTLVVDLEQLNGVKTHHERYMMGQHRICKGFPTNADCQWLTDDVDVVFVCETPLNYELFRIANDKGVVTMLQFNFEFLDYLQNRRKTAPTYLLAPSRWRMAEVENLGIAPVAYLPIPVDSSQIKKRTISQARTFTHIVGRAAVHDRNGTSSFLGAAKYLTSKFVRPYDLKFKIFIQSLGEHYDQMRKYIETFEKDIDLEVVVDCEHPKDLYSTGDVLVLPRRYGGLCLPMNEALAAGMPVIMPDISPNSMLPPEWLVPAEKVFDFEARTTIDVYEADIPSLAKKMLEFSDSDLFMASANKNAKHFGEGLSWKNMKETYDRMLQMACQE